MLINKEIPPSHRNEFSEEFSRKEINDYIAELSE